MYQYQNYLPQMNNAYMQQQNPYMERMQQYQMPQQQINQATMLSGRVVNKEEEIVASEIPMDGSISYFPVNGTNTIIGKKWNANGTIDSFVYMAQIDNEKEKANNLPNEDIKALETAFNEFREDIFNRFDEIKKFVTPKTTRKKVETDE